jgi:hypothetical protein
MNEKVFRPNWTNLRWVLLLITIAVNGVAVYLDGTALHANLAYRL